MDHLILIDPLKPIDPLSLIDPLKPIDPHCPMDPPNPNPRNLETRNSTKRREKQDLRF